MSKFISLLALLLALKLTAATKFDSRKCDDQLIAITEAISDGKLWAIKRKTTALL